MISKSGPSRFGPTVKIGENALRTPGLTVQSFVGGSYVSLLSADGNNFVSFGTIPFPCAAGEAVVV